jgi:Ca2+-binding RTX toxin-like protein
VGTNGKNTIKGTARADVIWAGGGADTVDGRGGKDRICGGGGNDTLKGGAGADKVDGGLGKDKVDGGGGNDTMLGKGANDRLVGGTGTDIANGGPGTDTCLSSEKRTSCELTGSGGGGPTPTGSDLSVTDHMAPANVTPPNTLTVQITVKNNGPQSANNITVRNSGLENQTGVVFANSPSGHSCFIVAEAVECSVPALDTGFSSTAVVTFTYNVTCDAPTPLNSIAAVTFDGTDPNTLNNTHGPASTTTNYTTCA